MNISRKREELPKDAVYNSFYETNGGEPMKTYESAEEKAKIVDSCHNLEKWYPCVIVSEGNHFIVEEWYRKN